MGASASTASVSVSGTCKCDTAFDACPEGNRLYAYPHESYSFMRVRSELRKELLHDNDSKCDPRKKVAFLKTHKTASTTIQNILLRFGRDNDLNFVLSADGPIMSLNHPFNRSMIHGTLWENAGLKQTFLKFQLMER